MNDIFKDMQVKVGCEYIPIALSQENCLERKRQV